MDAVLPTESPQTELVSPNLKPQEISFSLPKASHTTAHIHLTLLEHCATVLLSTSTPGDSAGSFKPLGSFVYAMPDSTIEYTTRVAKILARRIRLPVYVGCSIDPNALGLTVEEEMEGLTKIVNTVAEKCQSSQPR